MKVFAILFVTIAVASMAAAGHGHHSASSSSGCTGLAFLLGPVLRLLQPLLNGVNSGLQAGAGQVACGVHDLGNTLQSTVSAVGTIAGNAAAGAGGAVKALPATLYKTTQNLQTDTGTVGDVLDSVVGGCNKN